MFGRLKIWYAAKKEKERITTEEFRRKHRLEMADKGLRYLIDQMICDGRTKFSYTYGETYKPSNNEKLGDWKVTVEKVDHVESD